MKLVAVVVAGFTAIVAINIGIIVGIAFLIKALVF